jgi:DNA modification methylase
MIPSCQILCGDAAEKLSELPERCVQMCVTSPPYFGLRQYGDQPLQIGLENTHEEYVQKLVAVARGIRRVLRDDGTFWLVIGDSYYNYRPGCTAQARQTLANHDGAVVERSGKRGERQGDLKEKDLMLIPHRVALSLQKDGWWVRSEIIWHKRNCMPESTLDRPTRNHEQIFLLTKNQNYYYNGEAIKEPISPSYAADTRAHGVLRQRFYPGSKYVKEGMIELQNGEFPEERVTTTRNKRTVWTVTSDPYPEAHFATYPPDLIKPCILAGSRLGDTVLDPFAGSGTTGEVATELGRNSILIELNPDYIPLIEKRTSVTPGLPL